MKRLLGRIMVVAALILPFAAAAESDGIAIDMNRAETADALVGVSSPLAGFTSC